VSSIHRPAVDYGAAWRWIGLVAVVGLWAPSSVFADQRWSLTLLVADARDRTIAGNQTSGGLGVSAAVVPALTLGLEGWSGPAEFRMATGIAKGSIGALMFRSAVHPPNLRRLRPFAAASAGWMASYAARGSVTTLDRDSFCFSVGAGLVGPIAGRTAWRVEVDRVFERPTTNATEDSPTDPFSLARVVGALQIRLGR
jgi:hypothetical protein